MGADVAVGLAGPLSVRVGDRVFGSIPAGTAETCFWLREAGPVEAAARLAGETSADVCVIGGGFVGLWTAIELKRRDPALDVVLLEATTCGAAASGRNGGFVLTWWGKISLLRAHLGGESALHLARAADENVREIGEFCRDHQIDAEFCHGGWIWAAATAAQENAWASTVSTCDRLGVQPFRELDRLEVARRTGSPVHRSGVFEPGAATVQPAKLALGLRRVAIESGVRVFEHSPAVDLDRASPALVHTRSGLVRAQHVVVATNVWAAGMPEFRRKIVAISSDMIVTAPIPERLEEIGWTGGECITDSQMMIHWFPATPPGALGCPDRARLERSDRSIRDRVAADRPPPKPPKHRARRRMERERGRAGPPRRQDPRLSDPAARRPLGAITPGRPRRRGLPARAGALPRGPRRTPQRRQEGANRGSRPSPGSLTKALAGLAPTGMIAKE